MLKKLLKYDLASVFQYWWIAAVTVLGLSVVGGWAITVLRDSASEEAGKAVPMILDIMATAAFPLIYLSFVAFGILTAIFVFLRYYKNFFSDEGYLTFTLPVKKTQLIHSKLLTGSLASVATTVIIIISVLLILGIGFFDQIATPDFWKGVAEFFGQVYELLGAYCFVYVLEILLLLLVSTVFSNLFLYDCIAMAAMLTKKAKGITAIAIYYVANGVCSTIVTIFTLFGMGTMINAMFAMEKAAILSLIAILLLGGIVMSVMFTVLLYILQYWMIDRKLNLS